jgi:K+-transporting ATPase ATPase C chain
MSRSLRDTPRPFQPAITQRHIKAEVAQCVGGVVTPIRGNASAQPAVPPDAVTASGSGLDPDISPAYARLQAPRVARERGIPQNTVVRLIDANTTGRPLGVLGEPVVNVLHLNLALDRDYPKRTA